MKKYLAVLALVLLFVVGAAGAMALTGTPTTGTVTACATASVPAHTIADNGTPAYTIPSASATQCSTTTYTVPTVTQTVTTTVAATTTTPTTTTTPATSPTGPYQNTTAPSISGTPTVGSTLTANAGTWSPEAPSYRYAWHRCDASGNCPNVGTNSPTYALTTADAGQQISLQVAPIDGTGTALWAQSGFAPKTAVVTDASPAGSFLFDGRAKNMTTFYSNTSTDQAQAPTTWDCLCFNNGSLTLASDTRYGKAYKAVVGPGDKNPWNSAAPTNAASGQTSKIRDNDLGKWDWYALAVKVPSGWQQPDWTSILSLGYETIQGDQVALGVESFNGGAPQWELEQNSGKLTANSSGWYTGEVTGPTAIAPLKYDVWEEFVIGVKWATDHTGAVEVYQRDAGTTAWTLSLDRPNVPTYAYGSTSYTTISPDMHECPTVLDKVGLYYGYWDSARTSFPDETIYETGFVRAATMADAEASLP